MAYEYKVMDILWDLIFAIDGLIYEFITLMRLTKQNFEPDFILNIIENSVKELKDKKSFITKNMIYGLENSNNGNFLNNFNSHNFNICFI